MVATAMAKKSSGECTYASVKIDDEILPRVKAAAALDEKSVQDYISDVLNEFASKRLKEKPIKRRPRDE